MSAQNLLDHLVGECEQLVRNCEAELLRGLKVEHQLEFGWLQDREIGRLDPLKNAAGVNTSLTKRVGNIRAVAHEAAGRHELTPHMRGGHPLAGCQRNDLGPPIIKEWIGGND